MPLRMQSIITGGMLARQLKQHVDDVGGEGTAYSAQVCMDNINKAHYEVASQAAEAGFFGLKATYDWSVPSPRTTYEVTHAFPPDVHSIIRVAAVPEAGSENEFAIIYNRDQLQSANSPSWGRYELRALSAEGIVLYAPGFSHYRMTYSRFPGRLCYGTVQTSSTSSSVILGTPTAGELSPADDAYVGDRIALTSNLGVTEVVTVTGYDASTGTVEVSPSLSGTPATTWSWSFVSFLPENFQHLLVQGAASYFTAELPERAKQSRLEFEKTMDQFLKAFRPVDLATPAGIRIVERNFPLSSGGGGWNQDLNGRGW